MTLVQSGFDQASGCEASLSVASWRAGLPDAHEWDQLAAGASEPNPYFEQWYLRPSLEAFDPAARVRLATLRIDGHLVGLAPLKFAALYYHNPVPHISVWMHDNTFCGVPLIAPGFESIFWAKLLDWADGHERKAAVFHLPGLPEGSIPDRALEIAMRDSGRTGGMVERELRAQLASDLPPDTYFEQSLPNKKRKELRRQARRLTEIGEIRVDRVASPGDIALWADRFLTLEAASWKGREGTALANDPAGARFFRDSLIGAARRGRVEGLSLLLDGEPIAMLATFLTPPGAFSFKTTFDERFARYSPGVLLQKENLALLAREDIAWCDSCAAPDHPMIDHFWREQRAIVSRNVAIGGRARRALGARLIAYESRKLACGTAP
ncbi:GNAT family N-acetyltransferase [Alteriqipengyuania lutimaris]|uniref:GNAT family N-acetyltransferase n=1 Tax=Alteriqipengyuania lutimaris TaxID=1538146 RepID=A0A395LLH5_9SPHN|nr:GNAT family N-acetyltransferase [Alteriqipengyuania lutimaris]MBB3033242.1 CelD/BcsL family acetyltransferase involved in cellulose biosynthesis [Alteriqipengyuania lutimaris]RDS77711.1 GNAT family N-acetyltransferase [Alteriqipengyuania lutimaris]